MLGTSWRYEFKVFLSCIWISIQISYDTFPFVIYLIHWLIKFLNVKLWIRRQINIVKLKSDTQADSDKHTKFQFLHYF